MCLNFACFLQFQGVYTPTAKFGRKACVPTWTMNWQNVIGSFKRGAPKVSDDPNSPVQIKSLPTKYYNMHAIG